MIIITIMLISIWLEAKESKMYWLDWYNVGIRVWNQNKCQIGVGSRYIRTNKL